jgi:hypothetical protein
MRRANDTEFEASLYKIGWITPEEVPEEVPGDPRLRAPAEAQPRRHFRDIHDLEGVPKGPESVSGR